eukprot:m.91009 g.91009  ORF g.91009 m.91009 type:complete len:56 (-) comp26440_c1_seq4:119-286(-)
MYVRKSLAWRADGCNLAPTSLPFIRLVCLFVSVSTIFGREDRRGAIACKYCLAPT